MASLPLLGALAVVGEEEVGAERPLDRLQRRTEQRNRKQRNERRNNNNNGNNNNNNGGGGGRAVTAAVAVVATLLLNAVRRLPERLPIRDARDGHR